MLIRWDNEKQLESDYIVYNKLREKEAALKEKIIEREAEQERLHDQVDLLLINPLSYHTRQLPSSPPFYFKLSLQLLHVLVSLYLRLYSKYF